MALMSALLDHSVQHDDGATLLFPDHGPEVRGGASQGALGKDVGPIHRRDDCQESTNESNEIDGSQVGHLGISWINRS